MKRVSKFIANQYGGAHSFRKEKRRLIREIIALIDELRCGCVDFPGDTDDVYELACAARRIKADLSVKNWGR